MLTTAYGVTELAAPLQRTRELAAKLGAVTEFFRATALARTFHYNRRELSRTCAIRSRWSAKSLLCPPSASSANRTP